MHRYIVHFSSLCNGEKATGRQFIETSEPIPSPALEFAEQHNFVAEIQRVGRENGDDLRDVSISHVAVA